MITHSRSIIRQMQREETEVEINSLRKMQQTSHMFQSVKLLTYIMWSGIRKGGNWYAVVIVAKESIGCPSRCWYAYCSDVKSTVLCIQNHVRAFSYGIPNGIALLAEKPVSMEPLDILIWPLDPILFLPFYFRLWHLRNAAEWSCD